MITANILRDKSETFDMFVNYYEFTKKLFGRLIKTLRTDRGGEYVNRKFNEFFSKKWD